MELFEVKRVDPLFGPHQYVLVVRLRMDLGKIDSFLLPGNKILWETHPTSRAVDIERTPVEHF